MLCTPCLTLSCSFESLKRRRGDDMRKLIDLLLLFPCKPMVSDDNTCFTVQIHLFLRLPFTQRLIDMKFIKLDLSLDGAALWPVWCQMTVFFLSIYSSCGLHIYDMIIVNKVWLGKWCEINIKSHQLCYIFLTYFAFHFYCMFARYCLIQSGSQEISIVKQWIGWSDELGEVFLSSDSEANAKVWRINKANRLNDETFFSNCAFSALKRTPDQSHSSIFSLTMSNKWIQCKA